MKPIIEHHFPNQWTIRGDNKAPHGLSPEQIYPLSQHTFARHSPSPWDRVAYALQKATDTILSAQASQGCLFLETSRLTRQGHAIRFVLSADARISMYVYIPTDNPPTHQFQRFASVPHGVIIEDPIHVIAWLGTTLTTLDDLIQGDVTSPYQTTTQTKGWTTTVIVTYTRCTHDPRPLLVALDRFKAPNVTHKTAELETLATLERDIQLLLDPNRSLNPTSPIATQGINRILCAIPDGTPIQHNNDTWMLHTVPGDRGMPSLHCGNQIIHTIKWDQRRKTTTARPWNVVGHSRSKTTPHNYAHDPNLWLWQRTSSRNGSQGRISSRHHLNNPFSAMEA